MPPPDPLPLAEEIRRLADSADDTVGVSIVHLPSGVEVTLNGDESFPLASTYKIAMAATGLQRVDRGELSLGQMIDIPDGARVVSSVITDELPHGGVSLSLYNVMDLMLRHSDNTATDVFLQLAGGPPAVNAWLQEAGIEGLRVDRPTAAILRQFAGVPEPGAGVSYVQQAEALGNDPRFAAFYADADSDAYRAYAADPQDQGTPRAMSRLLARLWRGELLSPASTQALQATMLRCATGPERIKGRLPEGTPVAHKTGTLAGTANDAGVVTLPGGRGDLVMSIFVKNGIGPREIHERQIADIARAAYDYFVITVPPTP